MRRSPVRETSGLNDFTRLGGSAGIPFEEVGDGRLSEKLIDAAGHFLPAVVCGAGVGIAAGGAADETPSFAHWLEGCDDPSEGESLRGRGKPKATPRAALGTQHADAGEEVEGFGEVVARALHHGRDLVDAHRAFVRTASDTEHGVNGLLRGAGQPHRRRSEKIVANIMSI
jgi:hypothetical protein